MGNTLRSEALLDSAETQEALVSVSSRLVCANPQQHAIWITPGFIGGVQDIREGEHAPQNNAQGSKQIPLSSQALSPGNPGRHNQKVDNEIGIKLCPPIKSEQVINRNCWPVQSKADTSDYC